MFHAFDIVAVIILLFFTVRCIFRGFFAEVLAFGALFGGLFAALIFSGSGVQVISRQFGTGWWNYIVVFLVIFLSVYIVIKICDRIIQNIIFKASLENLDRALGLVLGVVEGATAVMIILIILQIQPFISVGQLMVESFAARAFVQFVPAGFEFLRGIR